MKPIYILILFSLIALNGVAQEGDKTYMTQGYSNDGDGYNICEIVVHADSTYTVSYTHLTLPTSDLV